MTGLPFNVPAIVESPGPVLSNLVTPAVVRNASQLARAFNLQNVHISQPQQSDFLIPQSGSIDPQLYLSSLGTKVLVDLTFHGQTYQNELGQVFTFPDITLETVLLSVGQTKNIVKTAIQGRKGTVKEYIGLGDYQLTINAIITGQNGSFPKGDVQDMIIMAECPNAITVTSWYLNMFSINSIVIESYDINQDEGQYSRQPISLNASSDQQSNLKFI
ncbi:DUF6046 domain-containing protein [Mucilaginibacter sp. UR6-11]|uniref:DUF6046 domain-containing protein n=1 Tax=Mucilaginibacter sp. UR6-11 TaxID=1435644 RepID=UPI001E405E83|nr:DUF6046 domain-containing protein [Mucilaginibacter sp. UR6-11]MCC8426579.1 DUF6046 domain-containing protein [Mucilaginibacter sp. UR6-11]